MLKQSDGRTAQDSHNPVAYHYKVPFVSFADLIDAMVLEDGISLSSIYVDGLHPNDAGMAYIGEMFYEHLDGIYAQLPAENNLPGVETQLPVPIISDTYSNTYQYFYNTIEPLSNAGWTASSSGWTTTGANNQIDFKLTGNAISLIFTQNDDADRGRAEVWVDDGQAVTIDAYMNEDWGTRYAFSLVQEGLSDDEHMLHIKSIEVSGTSGNKVNISRILSAGNVGVPNAVRELKGDSDWVKLYPNPSHGAFNIQYYVSETTDISIKMLSLEGKCIWNTQIANSPVGLNEYVLGIDPSKIAPGVYLVQVGNSQTFKTIQVLIY